MGFKYIPGFSVQAWYDTVPKNYFSKNKNSSIFSIFGCYSASKRGKRKKAKKIYFSSPLPSPKPLENLLKSKNSYTTETDTQTEKEYFVPLPFIWNKDYQETPSPHFMSENWIQNSREIKVLFAARITNNYLKFYTTLVGVTHSWFFSKTEHYNYTV